MFSAVIVNAFCDVHMCYNMKYQFPSKYIEQSVRESPDIFQMIRFSGISMEFDELHYRNALFDQVSEAGTVWGVTTANNLISASE